MHPSLENIISVFVLFSAIVQRNADETSQRGPMNKVLVINARSSVLPLKWINVFKLPVHPNEEMTKQRRLVPGVSISLRNRNSPARKHHEFHKTVYRKTTFIRYNTSENGDKENVSKLSPVPTRLKRNVGIEKYHISVQEEQAPSYRDEMNVNSNMLKNQKFNQLSLEHRGQGKRHFWRKQRRKNKIKQHRNKYGRRDSINGNHVLSLEHNNAVSKHLSITEITIIVSGVIGGLALISVIAYSTYRCFHKRKTRKPKKVTSGTNSQTEDSSSESDTDVETQNNETYSEESNSDCHLTDVDGNHSEGENQPSNLTSKDFVVQKIRENNCGEESELLYKRQERLKKFKPDERCHGDYKDCNVFRVLADSEKTTLQSMNKSAEESSQQQLDHLQNAGATVQSKIEKRYSSSSDGNYPQSDQYIKDIVRNASPSLYAAKSEEYSYAKASVVPSCYYTDGFSYNLPFIKSSKALGGGDACKRDLYQICEPTSHKQIFSDGTGEDQTKKDNITHQSKEGQHNSFYNTFNSTEKETKLQMAINSGSYTEDIGSVSSNNICEVRHKKGKNRNVSQQSESIPEYTSSGNNEETCESTKDRMQNTIGSAVNDGASTVRLMHVGKSKFLQLDVERKRCNKSPQPPQLFISRQQLSRSKTEEWLEPVRKCVSEYLGIGSCESSPITKAMLLSNKHHYKKEETEPLLSKQ